MEQQKLFTEKPVVDMGFISMLTMREKEIANWRDADITLGELGAVQRKLQEVGRIKTRMIEDLIQNFTEPIERLTALENLFEGKLQSFSKKHEENEGWQRNENVETGVVTLSKEMEHGDVTIVTRSKVKVSASKV